MNKIKKITSYGIAIAIGAITIYGFLIIRSQYLEYQNLKQAVYGHDRYIQEMIKANHVLSLQEFQQIINPK